MKKIKTAVITAIQVAEALPVPTFVVLVGIAFIIIRLCQ